jgi:hypothetical protein
MHQASSAIDACCWPPSLLPLQTPVTGWLEAFAAHPKIGDLEGLRKKFGAFANMSKGEQAAAAGAPEQTLVVRAQQAAAVRRREGCALTGREQAAGFLLQALAKWNQMYEAKFGHIFIICATGKSAEEMLAAIQQR